MEYRVKRNSTGELYHSNSFLGMEFSDELYHWKYIKRKKVNGKWRYYYDKTANKLQVEEEKVKKAQKALDDDHNKYWQKMYKEDLASAKANLKNNPDGVKNVENWYNDNNTKRHSKEGYREGKWLRYDVRDAENDYRRREDSLGGKVDALAAKTVPVVVDKLNAFSDKRDARKKNLKENGFGFKSKKELEEGRDELRKREADVDKSVSQVLSVGDEVVKYQKRKDKDTNWSQSKYRYMQEQLGKVYDKHYKNIDLKNETMKKVNKLYEKYESTPLYKLKKSFR